MEAQIDNLKAAAFTPSVGSMPSGELMNQTINTSLGRSSAPTGPGPIRGIGSWEGFHNTAPAYLSVNNSGYRNRSLHKRRHVNPMPQHARKMKPATAVSAMSWVNNMTNKSLIEGGTSVTKLASITKLSRLF